jgi:hypothetical protein
MTVEWASTFPIARSCTGTVFWLVVLTITGIGAETGFFEFSLEQPEEKKAKSRNPKIPPKNPTEGRCRNSFVHVP